MAGVPSIVTRFGATEYLPENVVFKVDAGDHEAVEIREVLRAVQARQVPAVGERSRELALELYSSEQVALELSCVFERCAPQLARFAERWQAFEQRSAADLISEAPGYVAQPSDWELLMKPTFEEFGWK